MTDATAMAISAVDEKKQAPYKFSLGAFIQKNLPDEIKSQREEAGYQTENDSTPVAIKYLTSQFRLAAKLCTKSARIGRAIFGVTVMVAAPIGVLVTGGAAAGLALGIGASAFAAFQYINFDIAHTKLQNIVKEIDSNKPISSDDVKDDRYKDKLYSLVYKQAESLRRMSRASYKRFAERFAPTLGD